MKLGNLLTWWLGAFVAWVVAVILGWGLALAFTYEVLVPWLQLPVQYQRLAALIGAFVFDGVGAVLVLIVMALVGIGLYKIVRRFRSSTSA
jgi:hypothetical protein